MGESKGPEASQAGLGGHFRLVTFATSVSRVTGFVRDQLNAALFGAGWMSDAYFMAIRIPSLLRDLFAEGALSNAFIPSLTSRLGNRRGRLEAGLAGFHPASIGHGRVDGPGNPLRAPGCLGDRPWFYRESR